MLPDGALEQAFNIPDDGVDVENLRLDHLPPTKREQLMGEPSSSLGGGTDLPYVAKHAVESGDVVRLSTRDLPGKLLRHEVHVIENRGKEVVEVMGHAAGELAKALKSLRLMKLPFQPVMFVLRFQSVALALRFDTIGDVTNGSGNEQSVFGVDGGQRDLGWELRSIFAPSRERHPGAHWSGTRVAEVPRPMVWVNSAHSVGHQQLDLLSDEFLTLIAEKRFSLAVCQRDHTVTVHADDRIGRCLEQTSELRFCASALGHVSDGGGDDATTVKLYGCQGDLGRKLGTILPSTRQLHPRTHGASHGMAEVRRPMAGVSVSDRARHQEINRVADELIPAVPEERFGLRVDQQDRTIDVHTDDRVRNRLEKLGELNPV